MKTKILLIVLLSFNLTACKHETKISTKSTKPVNATEMNKKEKYIRSLCERIPSKYSYHHTSQDTCYITKENFDLDKQHCYEQRLKDFAIEIDNAFSRRNTGNKSVNYFCLNAIQEVKIPKKWKKEKRQLHIKDILLKAYLKMLKENLAIIEISLPEKCKNSLRLFLSKKVDTLMKKNPLEEKKLQITQATYYDCLYINAALLQRQLQEDPAINKTHSPQINNKMGHTALPTGTDSDPVERPKKIIIIDHPTNYINTEEEQAELPVGTDSEPTERQKETPIIDHPTNYINTEEEQDELPIGTDSDPVERPKKIIIIDRQINDTNTEEKYDGLPVKTGSETTESQQRTNIKMPNKSKRISIPVDE